MTDSLELSRRFIEPAFREMVLPLHNLARGAVASLTQLTEAARVGQFAARNLVYAGIDGHPVLTESTFGDIDCIDGVSHADYLFEAGQVDGIGLADNTPLAVALDEAKLPAIVIMNANKLGRLSMLSEMTWCIEDSDPQKPGSAFDQAVLSVVYLPRTDQHYREVMRVINVKQPEPGADLLSAVSARKRAPMRSKARRHLRLV